MTRDDIKDVGTYILFGSSSCAPCNKVKSILDKHSSIDYLYLDFSEHRKLTISLGVLNIPTLINLDNGVVVDRFVGLDDICKEVGYEF